MTPEERRIFEECLTEVHDPLRPARGILNGLALSAALIVLVLFVLWMLGVLT